MNDLIRRSLAAGLLSLLLVSFMVAACGGSAESEIEEPASITDQTETEAPTAVDAPTAVIEEVSEAEEAVEAQEEAEVAQATEEGQQAETTQPQDPPEVSAAATCEALDIPANDLIPVPAEADWAKGLATASITVIEYGDFQ